MIDLLRKCLEHCLAKVAGLSNVIFASKDLLVELELCFTKQLRVKKRFTSSYPLYNLT